jgi:glycosyltransferase involved in cell wall biosynthesis
MKILFISHSSVLKYHQQKLEILAEKYNLDITLVTPPFWNEGGAIARAYTGSSKIKYEIGKAVVFKKRMVHFYLNTAQIIKKTNPDIVHIEEEPFSPACRQFLSAAKRAGKKTVFFTWENMERKHNPVYTWFDKYCINNADAAIAGNADGRRILLNKGFSGLLEVIPQYGVNLEDFKDREIRPVKQFYNIAYAGRITPEKGMATLLDAIKQIRNVKLHIAGAGDLESIKKMTGGDWAGIQDRVEFDGRIPSEKMPGYLSEMDLLVLPSIKAKTWKEQFGRVLIEAMAAKVPVIGSDSGEIPNVIADAGLIFHEGSADELAARIKDLIGNEKLYKDCVEKGYKRVMENYTNEIIADKIYNVYNKL